MPSQSLPISLFREELAELLQARLERAGLFGEGRRRREADLVVGRDEGPGLGEAEDGGGVECRDDGEAGVEVVELHELLHRTESERKGGLGRGGKGGGGPWRCE